jgi:nicotinamidase-related amidase
MTDAAFIGPPWPARGVDRGGEPAGRCSRGFANTDLDLDLKRHGIQQLIVMGLITPTCLEPTSLCC